MDRFCSYLHNQNSLQMNTSHASSRHSRKPHQANLMNSRSFNIDLHSIQQQIRSIEDEIQFTICNYESILQTQKKNTAQRNQFLLYLIQSMKQKQNEELVKYQSQLQIALHEKEQAHSLQSQMKNIGQGVDSILQQGKRLKQINQSLMKQLQEQNLRENQLDEEIQSRLKEINDLRTQVDEWEVKQIKWNRKKKDMIQLVDDAESVVCNRPKLLTQTISQEQDNSGYRETINLKKLMNKYQQNGNGQ